MPLPALLLLLSTLNLGAAAIECYICNSAYHEHCLEISNKSSVYLRVCPPNPAQRKPSLNKCRKLIMIGPSFDLRVDRYCAVKDANKPFYQSTGSKGVKQLVYTCESDRCNSAYQSTFPELFYVFAFLFIVKLSMKMED